MRQRRQDGFTIVELIVTLLIFSVVIISIFGLYTSLVQSTIIAKRRAVALSLATNQMEHLKSLPYDHLAIAGGSIITSGTPLPAAKTETINGVKYTITTRISYVDDAFDGCTNYPNLALKQLYCRNYSAATPTAVDSNPQDYKIAHVSVTDKNSKKLAEVDTQISARVAETASTTGALFVNVIDDNGNPVPDAAVSVVNSTLTPNVSVSDNSDTNGTAIFYGLPPDNAADYIITASKDQYSSLYTKGVQGSRQPTYPNQRILAQQPSYVTLILKPMAVHSLVLETTTETGAVLPSIRVHIKGGYKSYTAATNGDYYYNNMNPSDTRPTTNASGLAAVHNLVPGSYLFCGSDMTEACENQVHRRLYLVAAIPYGGENALNPITIPSYRAATPPSTTFSYNGFSYLQKVRLMFSESANFPRVFSLTPDTIVKATDNPSSFAFVITGYNLSCGSSGTGCSSIVKFVKGGVEYPASCTGGSGGTRLSCTANISAMSTGKAQLVVGTNQGTLTLPADPQLGGLLVE